MSNGYIKVSASAAGGAIPIEGAGVEITEIIDGKINLIAYRTTDRNGKINAVSIEAPDEEETYQPEEGEPFTKVNIKVTHPTYETVNIFDAQVFSNIISEQNVIMIPISEFDNTYEKESNVFVNKQNL